MEEVNTLESYQQTLAIISLTQETRNSGFEPYQKVFLEAFETLDSSDVQQLLLDVCRTPITLGKQVITIDILRRAIEMGVDISANGDELFIKSLGYIDDEILKFFLDNGADVSNPQLIEELSISDVDISTVKMLLELGAPITDTVIDNCLDSAEHIQLLMEHGCDINLIAKLLFKSLAKDDENIIKVFHLLNNADGEVSWSDIIDDAHTSLENDDSDSDTSDDE